MCASVVSIDCRSSCLSTAVLLCGYDYDECNKIVLIMSILLQEIGYMVYMLSTGNTGDPLFLKKCFIENSFLKHVCINND